MMEQNNVTGTTGNNQNVVTEEVLIELYMNTVLESEKLPRSVYKFSKENNIDEETFYHFFGSFEALQKVIWNRFFFNAIEVIQKSGEYDLFSTREKLLTFYYTFFEVLTANRSYILMVLSPGAGMLRNLDQLKGLRKLVKEYSSALIRKKNQEKSSKYLKNSETIFSEAVWVQLLFLIKFWLKDNSARFESTDVAIEKSVNTIFDLFDTGPLERLVDFGKFLWKEKTN